MAWWRAWPRVQAVLSSRSPLTPSLRRHRSPLRRGPCGTRWCFTAAMHLTFWCYVLRGRTLDWCRLRTQIQRSSRNTSGIRTKSLSHSSRSVESRALMSRYVPCRPKLCAGLPQNPPRENTTQKNCVFTFALRNVCSPYSRRKHRTENLRVPAMRYLSAYTWCLHVYITKTTKHLFCLPTRSWDCLPALAWRRPGPCRWATRARVYSAAA